jgi:hypothetical protein
MLAYKCYKTKSLIDMKFVKFYRKGKGYDTNLSIRNLKKFTHIMINSVKHKKNQYFIIDIDIPIKLNDKLKLMDKINLLPNYIIVNNNYNTPHYQMIYELEGNYHMKYYWDKFMYIHKLLKKIYQSDINAHNTWCRNPMFKDKEKKIITYSPILIPYNLDDFKLLPEFDESCIYKKEIIKKSIHINYKSFISTKELVNLYEGTLICDDNQKQSRHITLFKLSLKATSQLYRNTILPEDFEDCIYTLYDTINKQFEEPLDFTYLEYHARKTATFIIDNHDPLKGIDYNLTINRYAYRDQVKHLDNIKDSLKEKQSISAKITSARQIRKSINRLCIYIQQMKDRNIKINKNSLYKFIKSTGDKISENTISKRFDEAILLVNYKI